jgi:hypothetical protein
MVGVGLWLAQPLAALAEPSGVHLEWRPPLDSTCPVGAVIEGDVERALDRQIFAPARAAELHVRGYVEDGSSEVVVRLEARNVSGKLLGIRALRAPAGGCMGLRNDIDLVLMLLVEGTDHVAPAGAHVRVGAGLWGGLVVGALPRPAWSVGPVLTLAVGPELQLRADAAYWLPVAVQTTSGIRADLHAASLALRVCPRVAGDDQGVLSLRVCAGAVLGVLIAAQQQPAGPAPQLRVLSQALLELRVVLHAGSAGRLELAVGPTLAFNRPSIVAVGGDSSRVGLFRPSLLGTLFALAWTL